VKDTIEQDADTAVAYYKRLIGQGMRKRDAVQLTASYVSSLLMNRYMSDRPSEPWRDPD
jgi:hypothetical protein